MRLLLVAAALLAISYLGICVLLYFKQDRLLFFPAHASASELETQARQIGFEPWTNAKGERIGWKATHGDPDNALLICHGNGGFALSRNYAALHHNGAGSFQFFLLEYPGYGARPGEISAKSLTTAAIEAIDTLSTDPMRRIWLMGQSLGTGIASAAAASRPGRISGLILLTPFDSLGSAASAHYPWLPVRLLLKHHLDSDRNLEKYHGPVAFIVAGEDSTIPPKHGEHLYAEYAGPKRLWLVPGAGHNDFDELLNDWAGIISWLRSSALHP